MAQIPKVRVGSDYLTVKIIIDVDGRSICKSTTISKIYMSSLVTNNSVMLKEMLSYMANMLLDSQDVKDELAAFTEGR